MYGVGGAVLDASPAPCRHTMVKVGDEMPKRMLPALMGLLAGSVVGLTAPPAPAARADSTNYTIEGITLGDRVERARDFRCEPSERAAEFNWCQRTRQDRGKRGPFSST